MIISISDLTLEITKFLDSKLPRVFAEPLPAIEYSVNGNSVGTGASFAGKHIWTINAALQLDEAIILQAIYAEFDWQRRQASNNSAEITVIDTTQKFIEKLPRTKLLAPGAAEELISNSIIAYYAQFKGWMIRPPELQEAGIWMNTIFTIQEI